MRAMASTGLVLFQSFVPVLIIDLSCTRRRKDLVSFRNINKLLLRGLITSKRELSKPIILRIQLHKATLTDSYRDDISYSACGTRA